MSEKKIISKIVPKCVIGDRTTLGHSALGFLFSGELATTYNIDGMMCRKSCIKKVNETLNIVDGVKAYQVDFESGN